MKLRVIARRVLLTLAVLPLCSTLLGAPAAGQPGEPPGPGGKVLGPDKHDKSRPLAGQGEIEPPSIAFRGEKPRHNLAKPHGPKRGLADPVRQSTTGGTPMPDTTTNFDGVTNRNGVLPPDTNGAAGPNHYVQFVNLSFAIWSKATGTLVYGPVSGNTLWAGFGGACETTNDGDPAVLYDHLADRWFMSQFALPNYPFGPYYQCIAVSTSGDPTGSWYRYQFKVSDTKMNDYPKFGVWPDAYYMSVNQFTAGSSWGGQGVAAFERAQMLNGQPARMVYYDLFPVDANLGGMLPASLDGVPPAAGTRGVFAEMDDSAWGYSPDQIQIWTFGVDWTQSPPTSSFTKESALATAAFDSNLCGYARNCIPQPGTSAKVDALSDRLMYRLQYRVLGSDAAMVVNHTVDVDGTDKAGIRWYELRKGPSTGGAWAVRQQGTYAPADGDHRWMGSIAMDKDGNIGLGFSASSGATYPSIRYTGRLAGDALGTMTQGETTLQVGAGSQTHSSGRWGDYSALAVDPDGCTFWYTQEYYAATSSASWRTRIGAFKFSSCGGTGPATGADLRITNVATPSPATVGSALNYKLTVTNGGPDGAANVNVIDTVPATTTFVSATPSQGTCAGTATVSCSLGTLASAASATVGIVVTPTSGGAITNTASVSASTADPASANNTAQAVTIVSAPPVTVSGCNPSSGNRNQQLTVHVLGGGFQSGAKASFSGGKMTVQSVTWVNASDLAVGVKIAGNATRSARTVTVTNPDGTSASRAACFTVQ